MILDIELSRSSVETYPLSEEIKAHYLGGRGLGVKYVSDAGIKDAFSPDIPIVFAVGPFAGFNIPTSGRAAVVSVSPLTGTIFDCSVGGSFATALAKNNIDAIVIRGIAAKPSVIFVNGTNIRLEPCPQLWTLDVAETTNILKKYGSVACIGKAGENGVLFASIMFDYHHAAGRGGLGAVMGRKNIKALVIENKSANKKTPHNKKFLQSVISNMHKLITASPMLEKLSKMGTPTLVNIINYLSILPTENFKYGQFDKAYDISGDFILKHYKPKSKGCKQCPIVCKKYTNNIGILPEYETISMFGSNLLNSSLDNIIECNKLCNLYGMDTISMGSTIACYSEIEEKKLNTDAIITLVQITGERNGLGDKLALGSWRYAHEHGCPEASITVKKLELPGYDPRGALGLALAYGTSNRGGCHLRAYMVAPEILRKPKAIDRMTFMGKANYVAIFQDIFAALDSMIVCKFAAFGIGIEEFTNALHASTGIPYTFEEIISIGRRIWNTEHEFNVKAGFSKEDDMLPERFYTQAGSLPPINKKEYIEALEEYYSIRGWEETSLSFRSLDAKNFCKHSLLQK